MRLFRRGDGISGSDVLIMGLGTKDGGVGAALFCHSQGARVTVTDILEPDRLEGPMKDLEGLGIRFVLGGHRVVDFVSADLVIRNPGIRRENPFLATAARAGAAVDCPTGIFCELFDGPWIGVTGTKGKSFTTHLVSHLLTSAGIRTVAAGNNCVSPLRFLCDPDLHPVLELSSWQLSEMDLHRKSPPVGCWLNFFPDHMNWYASLEDYRRDKETIFRHQEPHDTIVLPADDTGISGIISTSRKMFFSSGPCTKRDARGCFIEDGWLTWRDPEPVRLLRTTDLPDSLTMRAHMGLLPAAICCAVAAGASPGALVPGIADFPGLHHRFQRVGSVKGVQFINDSAATTPESVMLALNSLTGMETVLIAGGGGHKNLDYDSLARFLKGRLLAVVLFREDPASARLRAVLGTDPGFPVLTASDMEEAVSLGYQRLVPRGRGVLLLSPASSGAPLFVDLFHRGDQFIRAVEALTEFRRS